MRKLYLLASERSGTNLLRRELNKHQSVYLGMSPAHLLKHLYYNEPFYGDLSSDSRFLVFINDAIELCTTHFSPWDMQMDAADLLKRYGGRERGSIYFADFLMGEYAKEVGFEGYFCKDNLNFEFTNGIANALPDSKFIYLYRDPRDFVLSQIRRPNIPRGIMHYAHMWAYEQTKCIRSIYSLSESRRVYSLSYESFIDDPAEHIDRILKFLGINEDKDAHKYSDNIVSEVHDWKNLNKDINQLNKGKHKASFSDREISIIESITWKQMTYLGYKPSTQQPRPVSRFDKLLDRASVSSRRLLWALQRGNQKQPDAVKQRTKLLNRLYINYLNRGC